MKSKDRQARGSRVGGAKLTESTVRQIRGNVKDHRAEFRSGRTGAWRASGHDQARGQTQDMEARPVTR